ncbi:MAG: putative protease [Planctomycetaceae bacterium]
MSIRGSLPLILESIFERSIKQHRRLAFVRLAELSFRPTSPHQRIRITVTSESANSTSTRPELLAPAGDWDCVRAAVENGANAIYFGLDCGFNARERAANFDPDDLPNLMDFMHRRGVKGYVTLNTLAFPSELKVVEPLILKLAESGVDAVLVQDIGLARLIRATCPDLPIHASTQMTLTSAECIEVAAELGIERVVLARELSVKEIGSINDKTDMSLEAFVHGALCVAYSGQCLTSESLGGRSANRGQCAQACRLPYDLICDGEDVDLGDVKYLLSPQDLAAYALIPDLMDAGICSLKIEGRLKQPEYVANITRHYAEAITSAVNSQLVQLSEQTVREMELSFSRGFSPGWFGGCDHKMLVPGLTSAKRGVFLGEVKTVHGNSVTVQLASPIAAGDGVVFDGDRANDQEQGGRIFHVTRNGKRLNETVSSGLVELEFGNGALRLDQLWAGQQVWKTDDPKLTKKLRQTFSSGKPQRRVPVDLKVLAAIGEPLRIEGSAANGATCDVESESPLEEARRHPLTEDVLNEQLGRLGKTVFELGDLSATITGSPMIPLSVLGGLRREMIQQLEKSSTVRPARRIADESALEVLRGTLPTRTAEASHEDTNERTPALRVLCRSLAQLQSVLEAGVISVMVDFQDIREYREAVTTAHAASAEIFIATPRIQKPGEMGIFKALQKHGADGILVRNFAGLRYYIAAGIRVVADFSLNIANDLTAQFLIDQGAERVTASYDLNREQLLDLVEATPPEWLEVVVHQHMPMFHMEHCVFCAVLSPGTNKHNCGRPCDDHVVQLRDRVGMEHPLTADVGCRNTLFNAVPQSAAEAIPQLLKVGVRDFRIELLDSSPSEVSSIIDLYRSLIAGGISPKQVWSKLKASNRVGVTRGTLEERRDPMAIL